MHSPITWNRSQGKLNLDHDSLNRRLNNVDYLGILCDRVLVAIAFLVTEYLQAGSICHKPITLTRLNLDAFHMDEKLA